MNLGLPLKETTSWMFLWGGHSISHSLSIAPALEKRNEFGARRLGDGALAAPELPLRGVPGRALLRALEAGEVPQAQELVEGIPQPVQRVAQNWLAVACCRFGCFGFCFFVFATAVSRRGSSGKIACLITQPNLQEKARAAKLARHNWHETTRTRHMDTKVVLVRLFSRRENEPTLRK